MGPPSESSPDHVALDRTRIRVDEQQYFLYAAADTEPNRFIHVRRYPTHTTSITREFTADPLEKHDVVDAVLHIDSARGFEVVRRRVGLEYRLERHGLRT